MEGRTHVGQPHQGQDALGVSVVRVLAAGGVLHSARRDFCWVELHHHHTNQRRRFDRVCREHRRQHQRWEERP